MDEIYKNVPIVKAEFFLTNYNNNDVDLGLITNSLAIAPTRIRKKEDWPHGTIKAKLACDLWEFSMSYETGGDINVQSRHIVTIFSSKRDVIRELQERFNMSPHICFVVHTTEDKGFPKMLFSREFIEFAAYINAEISIDYYRY